MKVFIAIFFACLAISQPVTADVINGKVVGIVDGDTIDVLDAIGNARATTSPNSGMSKCQLPSLHLSELLPRMRSSR